MELANHYAHFLKLKYNFKYNFKIDVYIPLYPTYKVLQLWLKKASEESRRTRIQRKEFEHTTNKKCVKESLQNQVRKKLYV